MSVTVARYLEGGYREGERSEGGREGMGKGENGSQNWQTLYVHMYIVCTHLLQCTCTCVYVQYSTVALFLYYKKGYNQGKSPNVHTVRLPPDNIVSLFL